MSADRSNQEIRPGSGAGLGAEPEPGDIAGGTGMVERRASGDGASPAGAAGEHRIGMMLDVRGPHGQQTLDRLAGVLDGARVQPPDDTGIFEIVVEAPSFEVALDRVWDAMAAAGADDCVRFAEHPDIPGHWRRREEAPGA